MINISKPHIGDEEKAAVLQVLDSGQLAQGPRVKEFEEKFAAWCGTARSRKETCRQSRWVRWACSMIRLTSFRCISS